MIKRDKPKKGDRLINNKGEYCIVKSIYKEIIKIQVCGDDSRIEPITIDEYRSTKNNYWMLIFPKTTRENVARHLLEYQLNLIGKTTVDTKKTENWFDLWTISKHDALLLEQYAIKTLKKVFKFNTTKAKETFNWWKMQFGLKII